MNEKDYRWVLDATGNMHNGMPSFPSHIKREGKIGLSIKCIGKNQSDCPGPDFSPFHGFPLYPRSVHLGPLQGSKTVPKTPSFHSLQPNDNPKPKLCVETFNFCDVPSVNIIFPVSLPEPIPIILTLNLFELIFYWSVFLGHFKAYKKTRMPVAGAKNRR
jgi:hypothetical protein